MSHHRDIYFERLQEHLLEREWSEVQILNLAHRIGRSALMSHEGVLEVLEYQQQIDENIQAQKDHDRVFTDKADYQQPTLGFDSEGDYHRPNGWDVT